MSGNKIGGQRAAVTNREKYGDDYYKVVGAIGGRVTGVRKGFAIDDRNWLDKLLRKPSRAQRGGALGGKVSRRGARKTI